MATADQLKDAFSRGAVLVLKEMIAALRDADRFYCSGCECVKMRTERMTSGLCEDCDYAFREDYERERQAA